MKSDIVYLKHIIESIKKIEKYIKDIDFDTFSEYEMMLDAVVRGLEVIGEASNKISIEFRNKHEEIPWRAMKSMRNYLIHEYFGVDPKTVWDTCKEDLIIIKKLIEQLTNNI